LGANTFELGLIVSIFSITAIISKIPLGYLAEKIGKWPIIPSALIGQAVCFFLYSIAPNPSWLYPIRIFHSLITAAFLPVIMAIIADISPPDKRGDRLGRFLTSFGVATMLGPFFGGILLTYIEYRQLFRVIAVFPLLAGFAFLFAKFRGGFSVSSRETGPRDRTLFSAFQSLKRFILSRNIMILLIIRVSYSCANAFFITFFAVYAFESLLFTSSLIAILFGIRGVTNTLLRIPAGKLSDRIGTKIPLMSSISLAAVSFFIISEAKTLNILVIAIALYGLSHGIRAVAEWALFVDNTPPELRATGSAYFSVMFNIGEALGAVAAGTLSLILPLPMLFKIAAGILIMAIVSSAAIRQGSALY